MKRNRWQKSLRTATPTTAAPIPAPALPPPSSTPQTGMRGISNEKSPRKFPSSRVLRVKVAARDTTISGVSWLCVALVFVSLGERKWPTRIMQSLIAGQPLLSFAFAFAIHSFIHQIARPARHGPATASIFISFRCFHSSSHSPGFAHIFCLAMRAQMSWATDFAAEKTFSGEYDF